MNGQKKAMWVVFKMDGMPRKEEMRARFEKLYHIYQDHPDIESKCWLINEEANEWGALYVFRSEDGLKRYLESDLWVREIPERWGLKPNVVTILDPGPILYKKIIDTPQNSWISE
jgi:hypothetical protein